MEINGVDIGTTCAQLEQRTKELLEVLASVPEEQVEVVEDFLTEAAFNLHSAVEAAKQAPHQRDTVEGDTPLSPSGA